MPTTSTTSLAARSSPRPAKAQRQMIFLHLLDKGPFGATLEEIEKELNLAGNTVRPRRLELEEKLLVVNSGTTRPTCSGRQAVVWIIPAHIRLSAIKKLNARGYSGE